MAKTTDELFAEATEADYETAEPVTLAASDTEEEFQFRIDEHLRTIAIPEKGVVAGVEGDLNVNIARFTMTRYYHGRDLSKLNIRINYRNANGQVNYYTVSDATVSGDSIVFSWEFAADVTQYKGNVQFVVYLFSATNAVLKQRFFTTLGTLEVLEGLEVDSSIPVSEQTDILLHLKKDLSAYAEEVKKSLPADYTAMTEQVSSLKEDIDDQKIVPMASVNPYKIPLNNYDVVITTGKYLTGRDISTNLPTMTQQSNYPYDVIDIKINHNNTTITVPYDYSQNVGQAFVLYTEGVQSNNATPDHVNKKQIGVIDVTPNSYTVNLNDSHLNYARVAFTVPKGRRDFYFSSRPDEGELGKLIDKKISVSSEELISKNILIASVNMFYSIGAIGDSYTAGSALSSDGKTWQDVTDLSWIATMGKRAGIYWSNYGKGGATTKSYITDKLPTVLSGQAKDLYFVDLGINDYLQKIPVGTISDIKDDYTENGESYFGWYGSIIAQVQAHAPKAKIVLVKIWTDGTAKIPYDNAIDKIAEHFRLPVINPFDDVFFNSSLYLDNMVSGHPTAMGYACMGLAMERLFSKCVVENANYFKYATIG
jgi:lysophospholipase L1-like esterase